MHTERAAHRQGPPSTCLPACAARMDKAKPPPFMLVCSGQTSNLCPRSQDRERKGCRHEGCLWCCPNYEARLGLPFPATLKMCPHLKEMPRSSALLQCLLLPSFSSWLLGQTAWSQQLSGKAAAKALPAARLCPLLPLTGQAADPWAPAIKAKVLFKIVSFSHGAAGCCGRSRARRSPWRQGGKGPGGKEPGAGSRAAGRSIPSGSSVRHLKGRVGMVTSSLEGDSRNSPTAHLSDFCEQTCPKSSQISQQPLWSRSLTSPCSRDRALQAPQDVTESGAGKSSRPWGFQNVVSRISFICCTWQIKQVFWDPNNAYFPDFA